MDVDYLVEYAGRLFDAGLVSLRSRGSSPGMSRNEAARRPAMKHETEAVAEARHRGMVSDRHIAGEMLAFVLARANIWLQQGGDFLDLVAAACRRTLIVDAVGQLTAP